DWTHTDTPVLNLDQLDTGHHDDTNPNLPINPAPTTQEVLAQIWQEVLDVPQVKPDDNFFALGGHSLSAVRMLFKARERLAAELTMRDLHEIADLAALAELVERRRP
ncbi:phosphopantetheine-binding protein, partial [Nonomuraea sp. NPDC050547]|uniref:phosphopantetheine-binding protein n=1 Tax=Nonomuraea sp. NPDC050547 TaxID=3364368 RepID=UPI0037AA9C39